MNRGRFAGFATVALAACCGVPAIAKDAPKPHLSIDPIMARNLLAPIEEARGLSPADYRLDPNGDSATGQRARLSIDVGSATVFAISGRLSRQPSPVGPLDPAQAGALGPRRDSGKVYGMGIARTVAGVELGADYQYSKLRAESETESQAREGGPGRSHSLRATARIRFGPSGR